MIKPNKTFTLSASFLNEPTERTLVKTGTYADGNCFFHALLRAIDIQYRKQTTHYAHLRIVEKFRKDLTDWITPEVFQKLGDGEQIRMYFLTEFNQLLEQEASTNTSDPLLNIVHTVLPYKVIDKEILPLILNKHTDSFYKLFCWESEKYVREKLRTIDAQKLQAVCNYMRTHFIELFKKAHVNALNNFKDKMGRMNEYVDSFQMECISLYTGYNFVFIDENKDSGYSGITHVVNFDENRKCLIFLWIDENHFEIVGELENKNIINRIFSSDDVLVKTLLEQHAVQT